MRQPDISVIIPVYNTQKYLEACLDSVLAQTTEISQIIVVNDGSTDGSAEIVKRFQEHAAEVELHSRENSGAAAARNYGLSKAKGEYVMFVDSDDLLPPAAAEKLSGAIEADRSEMAVGMFEAFNRERTWTHESMRCFKGIRKRDANLETFPELINNMSPCNKLYRRDFIDRCGLVFLEGVSIREDIYFVCNAFYHASNVSVIPDIVYRYRARDEQGASLTSRIAADVIADIFRVSDLLDADEQRAGFTAQSRVRQFRYANELHALCYRFWPLVQRGAADETLFDALRAFVQKAGSEVLMTAKIEERSVMYDIKLGQYERARRAILAQRPDISLLGRVRRRVTAAAKNGWWHMVFFMIPLLRRWFPVPEQLWLVGEQHGNGTGDTGYAFFRHCREHHPHRNIFFVTKRENIDDAMRAEGNVIAYGSWRAFLFALGAEAYIFSDGYKDIDAHWHRIGALRRRPFSVFLQHGVFAFKRSAYYDAKAVEKRGEHFDLIVVSSSKEGNYVARDYGYDPATIAVTGLSRFDRLYEQRKYPRGRTILFVPTWRFELRYADEKEYLASEFHRAVEALTQHPLLFELLERTGYTLKVCFHHAASSFTHCYRSRHALVSYTDMTKTDLYDELIASPLLITDYSSVAFNMAYLNRPVIFYQHDTEAFLTVEGGSFIDFDSDLFGVVSDDPLSVIEEIKYNIDHHFVVREEYSGRADAFFAYRDAGNSERIFRAITAKLGKDG